MKKVEGTCHFHFSRERDGHLSNHSQKRQTWPVILAVPANGQMNDHRQPYFTSL